jgi:ATP-binding cassette subfamily F protein 3
VVVDVEGARLEVPGRTLLEDGEMWIERGEHVSLVGPNGAGKTTLIEALAGVRELDGGKLRRGHNVTIGFLSQHAQEIVGEGTALQAAQRATGLSQNPARALLGRFLFSGADAEKPVDGLSGGERRRLSLAVLMASGANFLVLDEPTNHLDLESREALEEALAAFDGSLLLVSHDRALLDAVGTRTLELADRGLRSYVGGWAEYMREREARRSAGATTSAVQGRVARARKGVAADGRPAPQGRSVSPTEPGRDSRAGRRRKTGGARAGSAPSRNSAGSSEPERPAEARSERRPSKNALRAQQDLERRLQAAEEALAAVEDELADPASWADPETAAQSTERHAGAKREVQELYARWEAALG